jgi:pyruvate dehydrogenase E1 component
VYDPAFAYEMATIIRRGIERMYRDNDDVFYYLTIYNENLVQPVKPVGVEEGIMAGLYLWQKAPQETSHRAAIVFSGSAHAAARLAQQELAKHYDVGVELWSATSYKKLREEAMSVDRWNRLHPEEEKRVPYVTRLLENVVGPVVAVTDYMQAVPDLVARWVPATFSVLGTDGFGRSDTREALRRFFETDAGHVTVAVLSALAQDGVIPIERVAEAIKRYSIDPDLADPFTR